MSLRSTVYALVISALCTIFLTRTVFAHAIIVEAAPAAHSTVSAGDIPIQLKFNSRVDRARSRLRLIDVRGIATKLELTDSTADRMTALAKSVAPGKYRLEWYVLSADGHITRGNIKFTAAEKP